MSSSEMTLLMMVDELYFKQCAGQCMMLTHFILKNDFASSSRKRAYRHKINLKD